MIITIDGPAGTGKSTVAKLLAKKLDYVYFDTGAMYRAVTYLAIKKNLNVKKKSDIIRLLRLFSFDIVTDSHGNKKYFVNKEEVTSKIRNINVSNKVSEVAAIPMIRRALVPLQRRFAKNKNVIFEGRDMGSVVFPYAQLKIYLVASPDVCAERRLKELKEKFPDDKFSLKEVEGEMKKRDEIDSKRKVSPLVCPKDAYSIDTSSLTVAEVIEKILTVLQKKQETIFYRKMKFFYRFILFVAFLFFKIFYRLKVYGRENFVKGKAILAANHCSYYDPPIVAVSSPEEIYFLARKKLFKVPLLGKAIKALNSLPVSRKPSDKDTFKKIEVILNRGKKILLFPEGERTHTGEIQKLLGGVGLMVYRNNCIVIPTYIEGTFKIWNRKKKVPKIFGKVICVFGRPIDPSIIKNMDKNEAIEKISDEIKASLLRLQKWCKKGCVGPLP